MRQPGGTEQSGQILEFFRRQVSQLPGVAGTQRLAQLAQQGQPSPGDADVNDTAVVGGAVALDEAAPLA